MNFKNLKLSQVDRNLAKAKELTSTLDQYNGWIKTIREALGMTTRQLAKRLKVSQTVVTSAEKNEIAHTITLAQLERFADALGCQVVYSFVPETSLQEMVTARVEEIAKAQVDMVRHTMMLEGQSVRESFSEQQVEAIKRSLLDGKWSKLWD